MAWVLRVQESKATTLQWACREEITTGLAVESKTPSFTIIRENWNNHKYGEIWGQLEKREPFVVPKIQKYTRESAFPSISAPEKPHGGAENKKKQKTIFKCIHHGEADSVKSATFIKMIDKMRC